MNSTSLSDTESYNLHPCVTLSVQVRARSYLLHTVRRAAVKGQNPVVEVDLDLCALMPLFRTRAALDIIAKEFEIPELAPPSKLEVLPGYSDEAWGAFLITAGLERKYPKLLWRHAGKVTRHPGTPFGRFHQLYWTAEWMSEDTPTPGLASFVYSIEQAGGVVVFLSGRWLAEHVEPTLTALRRAGIRQPRLVIGNPWHESLVKKPADAVSDAGIKAWRQASIRRDHGEPIALIDDRASNRAAVASAIGGNFIGIAIAIPGFTSDPTNSIEPLRFSTFEGFHETLRNGPIHPHLNGRYPLCGFGKSWRGLYEGLGRNERSYVIPRLMAEPTPDSPGNALFTHYLRGISPGSLPESSFLELIKDTIPATELERLKTTFVAAEDFAARGLADSFPSDPVERNTLWRSLVAAWLHSRDVETLMSAIGFPIVATGVHDLFESVDVREVLGLLRPERTPDRLALEQRRYSPWLIRWAATLEPSGSVNVGFLNPALMVSLLRWRPESNAPEDAMDVHRLSDHHQGDSAERYDPIEAAVNNVLHQREGLAGVRKEPISSWTAMLAQTVSESAAETLAGSSAGRGIFRDAVAIGRHLESIGCLTPWGLVEGASFD
jgi:hypothetical protein